MNFTVKFDTWKEARDYDKHDLRIYAKETFLGRVPTELSSLIHFFLEADEQNRLICKVIEKRKHEAELVVPAKFFAFSKSKEMKLLTCFELTYKHEFEEIVKLPWLLKENKLSKS